MTKEIIYQQALAEACTELVEIKEEVSQLERTKVLFMESLYDQIQVLEDKHNIYFDINLESMWEHFRQMVQETRR